MQIKDIMHPNPLTLTSDASLRDAALLMRSRDVGAVAVVDNGTLFGMVTDRDIAVRGMAGGKDASTPVSGIATRDVFICREDDSIKTAAGEMGRHQVRRLPVMDDKGSIVGTIALADIAEADRALLYHAFRNVTEQSEAAHA